MEIREKIIRTIAYFDLFDFPLVRSEVFSWLYKKDGDDNEAKAGSALDALVAEGTLKQDHGLVFLAGRDSGLLPLREERRIIAARKWRRARRWANFFSGLPGVELVGIGNTLAYDNAKDGSDIDFFIVTAPGCLWRARFFCAAVAALLDLRPRGGDNRDKLCLSFFVTADALDLSKLMRGENDIYMHYWIRQMVPLAGTAAALRRYISANPGSEGKNPIVRSKFWRLILSPLALFPGAFMKNWQTRHFPEELRKSEAKRDGSVVISDDILKFHVTDRRADIYEKWEKRVHSILNEAHQTR